jgi:DNA-binding LacI/PurR family transcriptional regulator
MSNPVRADSRDVKYVQLAEYLRAEVREGRLKPGDRLPSFIELRNKHSVSRGTVEKVHALLERDGLIVREQGRGVFVARTVKRTSTGIFGLYGGGFAETRNSLYWANLLEGLHQSAAKNRVQLLLLNNLEDPRMVDRLDGLVVSDSESHVYDILQRLPASLPRVSIMVPVDGVCCVLADDRQGAYDATRHLLELGHRSIGHLVLGHNHLIDKRLAGYLQALREYGIEPPLAWVRQMPALAWVRTWDSKSAYIEMGRQAVRDWISSDWNEMGCTALLAQNDNAAVGAIEEFKASGLNVPSDVSVIGFDGIESYPFFVPRLTTVQVPLREVAAMALDLLMKPIIGPFDSSQMILLPTKLVLAESASAPQSSDASDPICSGAPCKECVD